MFIGDSASVTISGVRDFEYKSYSFDVYSPSLIYVSAGFSGYGSLGQAPLCLTPTAWCFCSVSGFYSFAGLSGSTEYDDFCYSGSRNCSGDTTASGSMFGPVHLDLGSYSMSLGASMTGDSITATAVTNTFILRAQLITGAVSFVPEPATFGLIGFGVLGLCAFRTFDDRISTKVKSGGESGGH